MNTDTTYYLYQVLYYKVVLYLYSSVKVYNHITSMCKADSLNLKEYR